jgi:hypothetical protein
MEENSCRAKRHLIRAAIIVDKGQHKHRKLYPWASSTNSKIERQIGNILPIAW